MYIEILLRLMVSKRINLPIHLPVFRTMNAYGGHEHVDSHAHFVGTRLG
jgi:hypothetical protein